MASPSNYLDHLNLRLPDGLRDRIRRAARRNGRSMNAEVVNLLETTYPDMPFDAQAAIELIDYIEDAKDDADAAARIAKVKAKLAEAYPGVEIREEPNSRLVIEVVTNRVEA